LTQVLLGSKSPRRREILQFFSLPFQQEESDFDESQIEFEGDPEKYALDTAKEKAKALICRHPSSIILTADTVVHKNGRVYLKPENLQEACKMLLELSGSEHQVYTGVSVAFGGKLFSAAELTRVFFNEITESEALAYAKAIHTMDKAGGYAIQKGGSLIVKRIEGCYYNVMGLPIQTVRRLLKHAGIDLWDYL
jgi:septum formation protein